MLVGKRPAVQREEAARLDLARMAHKQDAFAVVGGQGAGRVRRALPRPTGRRATSFAWQFPPLLGDKSAVMRRLGGLYSEDSQLRLPPQLLECDFALRSGQAP